MKSYICMMNILQKKTDNRNKERDIKKERYGFRIIRVCPYLQSNLYCIQWREKILFFFNDLQLLFFDVHCLLKLLILHMQLTNLASELDSWVNLYLSNDVTDRIYATFPLYLLTGFLYHLSVHSMCPIVISHSSPVPPHPSVLYFLVRQHFHKLTQNFSPCIRLS